jgi:uncharacterized protein involved in exopolysaccharide biosynthesis
MSAAIKSLLDAARERRVAASQLREQADGLLKQVQRLSATAAGHEAEANELDAAAEALRQQVRASVVVVEAVRPSSGIRR